MPTPAKTDFIDPSALMRIKSLELRAKVVVEGYWKGLHRSPYHGFSVEFSEYRQYTRGDDPRYVDWKVYARSDKHFIKKFEDETNLRCQMFVDQSRSMEFGSGEFGKVDYANTLAATLGFFMMGQGDAVGLTTFHENLAEQLPPRNRPGHLRRLMLMLEKDCQGEATDLAGMLDLIPQMSRKRGLVVIVSDFLVPIETVHDGLRTLRAAGHDVVLFQVLDQAELSFNFDNASHFRDIESGQEFFVDPAAAREGYLKRFEAHQAALRAATTAFGIDYFVLPTNEHLEGALWNFVSRRQGAGLASRTRRRSRNSR
ncbi:MAG: hypothetical protein ACI8UO_006187 [Verrucomicrobiales bacterium]|jgi:uncharacterized protein (DUF58 family)